MKVLFAYDGEASRIPAIGSELVIPAPNGAIYTVKVNSYGDNNTFSNSPLFRTSNEVCTIELEVEVVRVKVPKGTPMSTLEAILGIKPNEDKEDN